MSYKLNLTTKPQGTRVKKETIITAIVFLSVGFLAGYIYDAQKNWNTQQKVASAGDPHLPDAIPGGTAEAPGMPPGAAAEGLPEGHPPIGNAAMIQLLTDQAAQNPKDPEPRLKLANFFYDHRQFPQAVEWYQKALELDPTSVSAHTDLGTTYFNLGRHQDALREYRKSLEINPKHEPTLFNMIVVNLEGTHDLAAARAAWDRLHKQNPNYRGLDRLKRDLDGARTSGAPAP